MKIERGTGNRPLFLLTVSKKNPHGEDFSFLPLKSAWKGIDIYKL